MATITFAVLLGSFLLQTSASAAEIPLHSSPNSSDNCTAKNPLPAAGTYYGTDNPQDTSVPTLLRISNGGAGLSGLVGALSNAFIDYKLSQSTDVKRDRFKIEWIKGDTTETLFYLSTGQADVGITYNKAAECQAVTDGVADRRIYGFRDHFYLVGPVQNPAGLKRYTKNTDDNENILTQFQKMVRTGNNGTLEPPARFLSRFDKSATNIKDSELFIAVGQVPWALPYSKWYHQYPMYPVDALKAAALLQEYTITDRGTWLSTETVYTDKLVQYNKGTDDPSQDDPSAPGPLKPTDLLLNPAFFLSSKRICPDALRLANEFLDWVVSEKGQSVVGNFTSTVRSDEVLYTRAPLRKDLPISNCSVMGL